LGKILTYFGLSNNALLVSAQLLRREGLLVDVKDLIKVFSCYAFEYFEGCHEETCGIYGTCDGLR
jgi:hypothetical protein